MYENAESRPPKKVNDSTKSSLWFHSTNRSEVDASEFNLFAFAAKSTPMDGEPENLTNARNVLLSNYRVVIDFRQKGIAPIFAPHIYYALQISGWFK